MSEDPAKPLEPSEIDAESVLNGIGWFRDDTLFMSLNLTDDEFDWIQKAFSTTTLSMESFLAALCEQHVCDVKEIPDA